MKPGAAPGFFISLLTNCNISYIITMLYNAAILQHHLVNVKRNLPAEEGTSGRAGGERVPPADAGPPPARPSFDIFPLPNENRQRIIEGDA